MRGKRKSERVREKLIHISLELKFSVLVKHLEDVKSGHHQKRVEFVLNLSIALSKLLLLQIFWFNY